MKISFLSRLFFIILIVLSFANNCVIVPQTGVTGSDPSLLLSDTNKTTLQEFINHIMKDPSGRSGIFIPDLFAGSIVNQPSWDAGFVSSDNNTVTNFSMATQFGSIGLLAHNYLAGKVFPKIALKNLIFLVDPSGKIIAFQVSKILEYQAITPESPYSNFINLEEPNAIINAQNLFMETYGLPGKLVLQTCIERGGNSSWGRLFIIADPVELILGSSNNHLLTNPLNLSNNILN